MTVCKKDYNNLHLPYFVVMTSVAYDFNLAMSQMQINLVLIVNPEISYKLWITWISFAASFVECKFTKRATDSNAGKKKTNSSSHELASTKDNKVYTELWTEFIFQIE